MNSFFLIDKEAGISSFKVISSLRKILGIRKIGHSGTLDPFATGLLICATGQYSRLLKYALSQDKVYEVELLLGSKSSTGDPEGEIIEETELPESLSIPANLETKVRALQELPIPRYSAVKIAGKRAYSLARQGIEVDMPMREVKILDFELLSGIEDKRLCYRAKVSKGTYIRALSEYIAGELGCVGMTTQLRRSAIADISVDEACIVEDLAKDIHSKTFDVHRILHYLPAIELSESQSKSFLHGMRLPTDAADAPDTAIYSANGLFLGIAKVESLEIIPQLVMDGGKTCA
ncbi:MAG: tRNA pseudouridine(55) synthase TruB [Candidatus Cloacimonetes bacterium]|jgi:tRNA pseudouridine55 synthase|nr:tRNA pseudouridine(55) synthase TruB [Candidatus Cloacimonadota bacterium]MDD2505961.1 tRNA pseudouridine(55) synthase TruB [Candidatus Cloacimonadota bacterium]MDD4146946.1 tRNA pseudouridine(55) synthase TruB [Candidatus Cloacimonadota bacterium]